MEIKLEYYIYMTTNKINNHKYIGKHYGLLRDDYLGSGVAITNAINKYGKENFEKEILYISQDEQENALKEREFIAAYNAVERDDFYNIAPGGEGFSVRDMSPEKYEEWKRKTTKAARERDTSYMKTPEYREKMAQAVSGEKNGMYGKHHTEESKRKMSESSKGKNLGEKNGMYGKSKDNAINGKKINMYDKEHNLIRTFNAKTAVLAYLGISGHTALDRAIKNHTLYKDCYWELKQD